ncbi:hypothetical protein G1K73_07275 [Tenacibaculum finnmarkense]|nr:hypothetical protein [Tenacibaculum finnmarkense]MCG8893554.1 hypothetical protein [Tenacibaculum finnmarkense]
MTLEQYGSLIILNQKNQKLASQNDGWYIYDFQDNLIQRVEIAQENGNDTENRIDVITHFLTSYLN